MTTKVARKHGAFANEELRPRPGTKTPLAPVPLSAVPGWNARIRRWAAAA